MNFEEMRNQIALLKEKLDRQEIFEEIISLLHCYSMKLYSSRKAKRIKEIIEEDESSKS